MVKNYYFKKIKFKISSAKNIENSEIRFNSLINEIIDILHFGIYVKIPIILKGITGEIKQTTIKYLADSIDMK